MSSKLPILKAKEVIRALERGGFFIHIFFLTKLVKFIILK